MEYDQQLFGDFELFRVFALLGDITPTFSWNNCSELFRVFVPAFFIGNIFTLFAATSLHFALFLQPFCKFRNLRIIPRNFAKSRNNSNYAEILCDCNTENRRTVSRILAGIMQHIPGSSCNILPGSAPALHSVILYPYPSPSSPPYHPITLTPNPGAEPSTRPGCVSICAKTGANTAVSRTFCGETDGAPRCRIPVSETRSRGP